MMRMNAMSWIAFWATIVMSSVGVARAEGPILRSLQSTATDCSSLRRRRKCRKSDDCEWKDRKCLARQEEECPKLDPRLQCGPEFYPPFLCGENKCQYGSLCQAQFAGFTDDQCKQDCLGVQCKPCPEGKKEIPGPYQCCPGCVDECVQVVCPLAPCKEGDIIVKDASGCCDICMPDPCSTVKCAEPQCKPGEITVKGPDGCCDICSDPCDGPDCSLVLCALPVCPSDQVAFTPYGQCCPQCVPQVYCFAECPDPVCKDDEVLVRDPSKCCAECVKKCLK